MGDIYLCFDLLIYNQYLFTYIDIFNVYVNRHSANICAHVLMHPLHTCFFTERILQYATCIWIIYIYVYCEQYVWCIPALLYDGMFGANIFHAVNTNDAFQIMGSLADLLQNFKVLVHQEKLS